MNIIHTPTQESYDRLMEYLEVIGYMVNYSGIKPTNWDIFNKDSFDKNKTCIKIESKVSLGFCWRGWYEENYPNTPIQTVDEYLNEVDPETEREYYAGFAKTINESYQLATDEMYATSIPSSTLSVDPFNKLKDKSMGIVKFAKDLTLSKNEKLLRKHGLKDECGVWTNEAIEIEAQLSCDDKTDEFVEIATAMDKETNGK